MHANVGIQMYTLRDMIDDDYLYTIGETRPLGYEGIELPGGAMEKLDPFQLKDNLSQNKLKLAGIVFEHEDFEHNLDDIISYSKKCDNHTVIYPYIHYPRRKTASGCIQTAKKMNQWAKQLQDSDMSFLYHIHGYEFDQIENHLIWDYLVETFDFSILGLEIDVYWVVAGKQDPIKFMREYGKYSPYIHFKDTKSLETVEDVEVGQGCIDMKEIAQIGKDNDASWFIVEQEKFDKPCIESAAISAKNLLEIRNCIYKGEL